MTVPSDNEEVMSPALSASKEVSTTARGDNEEVMQASPCDNDEVCVTLQPSARIFNGSGAVLAHIRCRFV